MESEIFLPRSLERSVRRDQQKGPKTRFYNRLLMKHSVQFNIDITMNGRANFDQV